MYVIHMYIGLKIINRNQLAKFDWGADDGIDDIIIDTQSNLLVTCSMDKTLIATDMTSGKQVWRAVLNVAPLCLDITPDGAYIGMGMYIYIYYSSPLHKT